MVTMRVPKVNRTVRVPQTAYDTPSSAKILVRQEGKIGDWLAVFRIEEQGDLYVFLC